jgi:hypothetical protein
MRLAFVPVILTAALAATAVAATGPAPPSKTAVDAALAAKLAHDAEIADQDRRSEGLNVEVNRKNREVQARNDAKKADFEKAMAAYKAGLAQQDAAAAQTQAAYDKAMADWKAAVAACKAGDVAKCQKPGAAPAN